MLRLLVFGLRALGTVSLRRARGARLRPSWSFRFEVVVELMRAYSRWMACLEPAALRRAADGLRQPLPTDVTLHMERVGGVPCTWFIPTEASGDPLVFVHGGAYVFGSAQQARGTIAELALRTRRPVLAPDYRLSPEHPCPAAVEDVVSVYRALIDGEREVCAIGLAGESAGAGITLAAAQRLRDAGVRAPAFCVLLSPAVELSADSPSWSAHRGIDYGDRDIILGWNRMYAGSRSLSDPAVSPLRGDCSGLPRLLVVVGSAELLFDDAVALVQKARASGTPAELHVGEEMVHAYASFGALAPPAERAWRAIAELTRA
jgi:acetyl esterase/lipase